MRAESREPSFWEVMDSCFISICKFGSFKNPFATITSLSELFFRSRRFILPFGTNGKSDFYVISMSCDFCDFYVCRKHKKNCQRCLASLRPLYNGVTTSRHLLCQTMIKVRCRYKLLTKVNILKARNNNSIIMQICSVV